LFYKENMEVVRRRVRSALRGNGNKSIDDVVQEVFVVVVKTWPAARDSPNPRGFVVNVANNVLLEHHRHEKAILQGFEKIAVEEKDSADASAGVQFDTVDDVLDAMGSEIPHARSSTDRLADLLKPLASRPKQQEAVEMHHAQGLTVKESAEFTGSNERTFRNNAGLGLARLKEHYSSEPPEP